uniref:Uncharacterized protein n=1 Tax=Rhizophora mucronata TaxID=61149 RepID=A0A2P2MUG3_RHIMU
MVEFEFDSGSFSCVNIVQLLINDLFVVIFVKKTNKGFLMWCCACSQDTNQCDWHLTVGCYHGRLLLGNEYIENTSP